MASNAILLRTPSKYASSSPSPDASPSAFTAPTLDWLHRTWTVTHSTLDMWRTAQNVRITYSALPPSPDARPRVNDLVEYEKSSGKGGVKTVAGVDTASAAGDTGSWDWRGKGLLFFVTSHWEVLGWGEREIEGGGGEKERWVVTWFQATLFTKEGVDLYSDRKGGMSEGLAKEIVEGLQGLKAGDLVKMVEEDMREVKVVLPWKES